MRDIKEWYEIIVIKKIFELIFVGYKVCSCEIKLISVNKLVSHKKNFKCFLLSA